MWWFVSRSGLKWSRAYEYDDRGNLLKHVDALGKATTYTYEATFNKVASIKDALGHTTAFNYDDRGNLFVPNGS